jgi:hypothetical protein
MDDARIAPMPELRLRVEQRWTGRMVSGDATSIVASWPDVLKYVGLASTVAYGVYATFGDFHEEVDGRRRLSRRGRVGIALLLLGGVAGLVLERYKDVEDGKRRAAEQAASRALLAQQDTVLRQLQRQLASLHVLDSASQVSAAIARTQLGQQETLVSQQGHLMREQALVAFNGVRLLQPLPVVRSVDAVLEASWDPAVARDPQDLDSPRAYADVVSAIVDTACRAWLALPESRDPQGGETVGEEAYIWTPAPGRPASGRRDLRLRMANVDLFGVVARRDGGCVADSVHVRQGSPFLLRDTKLSYDRMRRPLLLGENELEVAVLPERGDSTPLLSLGVRLADSSLRFPRHGGDVLLMADFTRGRLRWTIRDAKRIQADTGTDRQLSLLDLPGATLRVRSHRTASHVTQLLVRFARGRRLVLARHELGASPESVRTHRIALAEIERTPGEFAGLFPTLAPTPARARPPAPVVTPRATVGPPPPATRRLLTMSPPRTP